MGKGLLGKWLPDHVCSLMRVSRVSIVYNLTEFSISSFSCYWCATILQKWILRVY